MSTAHLHCGLGRRSPPYGLPFGLFFCPERAGQDSPGHRPGTDRCPRNLFRPFRAPMGGDEELRNSHGITSRYGPEQAQGGWGRAQRAPSRLGRGLAALDPSHPPHRRKREVTLHALGSYTSPKRKRGPQPIPSLALRASVSPPANVSFLAAWSILPACSSGRCPGLSCPAPLGRRNWSTYSATARRPTPNPSGSASTILTVSTLTRTTWPTRRTMYSGSSARFGSDRMPDRASSET